MDYRNLHKVGLPLEPVDWTTMTPADEPFGKPANFPPEQVRARIDRSRLRWDMQYGVWDKLLETLDKPLTVQVNLFRTIGERLAQFMMASDFTTGEDEADYMYGALIGEAAMAILRDATPIFWLAPEKEVPELLDPRFFWFTTEGWVYAVPQSAVEGNDAKLKIMIQRGETFTEGEMAYGGATRNFDVGPNPTDGTLGSMEVMSEMSYPDTVSIPGRFGQSMFDVIAPMVIEISRRHSANSYALNKLADPGFGVIAHPGDLPFIERDEGYGNQELTDGDSVQQSSAMNTYLQEVTGGNTYVSFDKAIQGLEPLEYNGRITESSDTIDHIRTEIETAVSMPDLFNGFVSLGAAPSGVALRRLNIPLYATVRTAQGMIRRGIDESLSQAGVEPSYEWRPVFEVLEGEADAGGDLDDVDR